MQARSQGVSIWGLAPNIQIWSRACILVSTPVVHVKHWLIHSTNYVQIFFLFYLGVSDKTVGSDSSQGPKKLGPALKTAGDANAQSVHPVRTSMLSRYYLLLKTV